MADSKITGLAALTTADPANDMLPIVDVSDNSMAASGTTKRISINNILACSPSATLASATITGALTANGGIAMANATAITSGGAVAFYVDTNQVALRARATNGIFFQESTGTNNLLTISNAGVFGFLDGAGGTRMTLNASGLGVGVASPTVKLDIAGAIKASTDITANGGKFATNASGQTVGLQLDSFVSGGAFNNYILNNASAAGTVAALNFGRLTSLLYGFIRSDNNTQILELGTAGTTRLSIDQTGNVGIGVTPSAWDSGFQVIENSGGSLWSGSTGAVRLSQNAYYATSLKYKNALAASQYVQTSGQHQWFNAPSGTAGNAITFTQAMTLDASGRLLVGQTSTGLLNINGIDIEGGDSNGGSYIIVNHKLATAAGQQYAFFAYNGVKTGDITQNGTTGVLYNTVSDYRLKESVQPLSNGLSRVSALKPSIYKWKSDGSSGEGFLAHELAEVVPFAVTGEKDAVNEDGSIKSQGVDMSRVVPILVAAIQELTAEVNALKKA